MLTYRHHPRDPAARRMKQSSNPVRLLAEVIAIIAVAETLVMLTLPVLSPGLTGLAEGLLDVGLLVLLSTPMVYWRCMVALRRQAMPNTSGPGNTRKLSMATAVGITATAQVAGLIATVGLVAWQKHNLDKDIAIQFDRAAERIEADVKRRFTQPLYGLKGARGFYAASGELTRREFQAYVASRDLPLEFPGIRGFGFIARVDRSDLEAFVARERADNAPDFAVRTKGNAPDLFVIKFIEPLEINRAAFGFDVGQEAVRREAAERAMLTGHTTLTGKITLVQDGQQSPGMLYLLPVYRRDANPFTLDERKTAFLGLLYAPIVASELFSDLVSAGGDLLRVEMFEGNTLRAENLLFDSDTVRAVADAAASTTSGSAPVANTRTGQDALAALSTVRSIEIGGRLLQLRLSSTPALIAAQDRSSLALMGVAGALVSMLAALTVWLLAVGRLRAQRLAEHMTNDLDRLARVVQHTNNAVLITDTQMRITWVNEGFTRLTGFTMEEAIGKTPGELLSSGKAEPAAVEKLRIAVMRGQACRVEVLNRKKDGTDYWIDIEVQPTHNAEGALVGFMEIGSDITERRRLDQAVSKSNQLMNDILQNLPCGLSVFDGNMVLVAQNPQLRSLLGLPDSLFGGTEPTFEQIIRFNAEAGEYGPGDVEAIVAAAIERVRQPIAHVFERIRPNGVPLEIRGTPLPGGGFISTYIDISENKKAQRQLTEALEAAQQASISKSQFVANMSHEIRTPMNAILGMLKLLQNTDLSVRQMDYAAKTEGAALSLLGLLNDILDFSKVEAGKMTLDPRPFRVDRLMRDLSVILSANMGSKSIEVLFDIDPALPKCLLGDDMRLQQVMINLGGNAIKFTEKGEVVLRLHVLEQTADDVLVEFSVKDSGIGIAPENQAHIFSGFSQAEASTTRRFGGTGLGLAISSRLVGLLGGTLAVDSALGQGSTFHFQIRFTLAQMPESDANTPAIALGALTTLVVDDNDVTREVLQHMLEPLGWQVEMAASGAQAIERMQARENEGLKPYDAIFMDWQMPEMDGWEASQRIRKLPSGGKSPIVVMVTAHGREMLSERSPEEQAMIDGFLVKPITASMVLEAVRDAKTAISVAASGHNPAAPKSIVKPKRLQGMRLLVVEDNKINQMVAKGLLTQEGADVTLADDGALGVAAVASAQTPFDAVLMDVQMPVMDGYTATRTLRQDKGLADLPIIAMTANAMASDRAACLDAGMNDHIGKPFDLDKLVALLLHFRAQ